VAAVSEKEGQGSRLEGVLQARETVDCDTLRAGIERFAAECTGREPQYIPYPATWLNGQGWLDEPVTGGAVDGLPVPPMPKIPVAEWMQWDKRLREYQRRLAEWSASWGPRPGEPGCEAPDDLPAEYKLAPPVDDLWVDAEPLAAE
jgi:hypothetical protein